MLNQARNTSPNLQIPTSFPLEAQSKAYRFTSDGLPTPLLTPSQPSPFILSCYLASLRQTLVFYVFSKNVLQVKISIYQRLTIIQLGMGFDYLIK